MVSLATKRVYIRISHRKRAGGHNEYDEDEGAFCVHGGGAHPIGGSSSNGSHVQHTRRACKGANIRIVGREEEVVVMRSRRGRVVIMPSSRMQLT